MGGDGEEGDEDGDIFVNFCDSEGQDGFRASIVRQIARNKSHLLVSVLQLSTAYRQNGAPCM